MKTSSGSVVCVLNLMSLTALTSLELVRAVSLPSGSISTPRSSLTSVADDSINIDVGGSSPPRTVDGNESGRKWRAARRQMLRRVFMLLSSPGEDDRELRAGKVVGTKVTGEKKRGGARTGDSTAIVAKSLRARQPSAGGVGTSGGAGQQLAGHHHTSNSASLPSGNDSGKTKENDVNIVCPEAEDGIRYFRCPTADWSGVYYCIDDHALCDQTVQCPNGEDEDQTACMFHQMAMNYFKLLMDSFIALAQTKN